MIFQSLGAVILACFAMLISFAISHEVVHLNEPNDNFDFTPTTFNISSVTIEKISQPIIPDDNIDGVDNLSNRQSIRRRKISKQCFKESCSQTVTGRQLNYRRALQIVQDEEYLTKVDTSIIRRVKRHKGTLDEEDPPEKILSRQTGPIDDVPVSLYTACSYYGSPSLSLYAFQTAGILCTNAFNNCGAICGGINIYPLSAVLACNYDPNCYTPLATLTTDPTICQLELGIQIQAFTNYSCAPTTTTTTTTTSPIAPINPYVPIIGTVGVAAVAAIAMVPDLGLVTTNGAPLGTIQAGSVGGLGGGLPSSSTSGVAALALVPPGLVPVAIFPPYATPRTLPAVSVIFAENPNILSVNSNPNLLRLKRSLNTYLKENIQRNYRRPSVFSGIWEFLLQKVNTAGNSAIKIANEAICTKFKLRNFKMSLKNMFVKKGNYHNETITSTEGYYNVDRRKRDTYKKKTEQIVNSLDDCFPGIPEPMYGFRTKVFLYENSPCTFGSTCQIGSPDRNFEYPDEAEDRQTGEEFSSDGPPNCRTALDMNCQNSS